MRGQPVYALREVGVWEGTRFMPAGRVSTKQVLPTPLIQCIVCRFGNRMATSPCAGRDKGNILNCFSKVTCVEQDGGTG